MRRMSLISESLFVWLFLWKEGKQDKKEKLSKQSTIFENTVDNCKDSRCCPYPDVGYCITENALLSCISKQISDKKWSKFLI